MKPHPDRQPPAVPSGYLLAAGTLLLLAPLALLTWAIGAQLLRIGTRRWVVAASGALPAATAVALLGPGIAARGQLAAAGVLGAASGPLRPSVALLVAAAALFGRWALLTAPVGLPGGLVAAAVPIREPAVPRPEWQASQVRAEQRAEARARRRAAKRAEKEGADPRSPALAVSRGGSVDDWRIGDLIVPPPRQLDYAMLLQGAPGVGKSTAINRLTWLCGQERRHLVVFDAKGGADALAEGVVAAYLAAFPDATVRLFPQERLDIWRGGPQAVVNRLVEVWDWGAEPYWREVAMTALRLALSQPGPQCRSGAELVARLDPNRLIRAWEHDPLTLGLVQKLAKGDDLPGVHIRVGNLIAALGGALDGSHSWEDADLWVVTVPAMVASKDADSALRVLMADYAHFTMAPERKGRRPSHLMVDEFAAIAGGRRVAIDLLERGRGARAGVTLSGQSSAAFGSEEERARLFAAVSAVLGFRTPQPGEIAGLAGSERVAEGAWQVDGEDLTGRATVTMRARGRVDQDQVRQLPVGEADLIVGGLVERVRIIPTDVDKIRPGTRSLARELVGGDWASRALPTPPEGEDRGHNAGATRPRGRANRRSRAGGPVRAGVSTSAPAPGSSDGQDPPRPTGAAAGNPAPSDGPAGAVAGRVSGPPSSPQEPRQPSGPAASALDPPPSSPIRRYRPPGAGKEPSPAGDRDNREE